MSQDNFNVADVKCKPRPLIDECMIAKKIYGRCKQQDCLKPVDYDTTPLPADYIKISSSIYGGTSTLANLKDEASPIIYPTGSTSIAKGQVIAFDNTVASLELVAPFETEVKVVKVCPPGPFSLPCFYDVTIQYTFSYNITLYDDNGDEISVLVDGESATEIPAYTTYTKLISLEGGDVDSNTVIAIADTGVSPSYSFVNEGNLPYVYVQAIASPLLIKIGKYLASSTPTQTFQYQADVVVGLFTIIELYRITNLCVASNGPIEVPQCQPSITNDPCVGFNQLLFPYDDFDPPTCRKC